MQINCPHCDAELRIRDDKVFFDAKTGKLFVVKGESTC